MLSSFDYTGVCGYKHWDWQIDVCRLSWFSQIIAHSFKHNCSYQAKHSGCPEFTVFPPSSAKILPVALNQTNVHYSNVSRIECNGQTQSHTHLGIWSILQIRFRSSFEMTHSPLPDGFFSLSPAASVGHTVLNWYVCFISSRSCHP